MIENEKEVEVGKFLENLKINRQKLSLELMTHPPKLASAIARVEKKENELAEAEVLLDEIYDKLFIRISDRLKEEEKRVVKDYVVALVKQEKTYKVQAKNVRSAKYQLGLAKARMKGFVAKTSMLEQYCYNYRKELELGLDKKKARIKQNLKD